MLRRLCCSEAAQSSASGLAANVFGLERSAAEGSVLARAVTQAGQASTAPLLHAELAGVTLADSLSIFTQASGFYTSAINLSSGAKPEPPPQDKHSLVRTPSKGSENIVIKNEANERWTAVLDKQTGGTYWWDKSTGTCQHPLSNDRPFWMALRVLLIQGMMLDQSGIFHELGIDIEYFWYCCN